MISFKQKLSQASVNNPVLMGVLNVTPDSFSDGGQYQSLDKVREQLSLFTKAEVDIVDIGGESTRPGANPVGLSEELDRVLPVIEVAIQEFGLPVSIDTYKVPVMQQAIKLGVSLVNDVNALQSLGAKELIASTGVMACLMHKQGDFCSMQQSPSYDNVVLEVCQFFKEQVAACVAMGIDKSQLILDPGFGFGKTLEHNMALFQNLSKFTRLGLPLLVGVSRKRMIAEITGEDKLSGRMVGSVVSALLAVQQGAKIIRVHDVLETRQALKVLTCLSQPSNEQALFKKRRH